MSENVKMMCVCELGYDKGAIKKTIENNIFTIYGNITKNNYIVIRYHGELIDTVTSENYADNLYISYFFDNNEINKYTLTLAKCNKCIGESYCALIPLEEHNNISFNFFKKDSEILIPDNTQPLFKLDIEKDPLTNILQKYGFEENNNLPVIEQKSEIEIKKIVNYIKDFFLSLFKKKSTV